MTRYHGWWLPVVDLAWRACNHRQGTSLFQIKDSKRENQSSMRPVGNFGHRKFGIIHKHTKPIKLYNFYLIIVGFFSKIVNPFVVSIRVNILKK